MSTMNHPAFVSEQYADDSKLSKRMRLYEKHSTNKQGLIPWLFTQYMFREDSHILELGCGNGRSWEGRIESLPARCRLLLSDMSEGMVRITESKYAAYTNVAFQQMDIQCIPHPDESFDAVIANHMLYHVPDLPGALSEVRRVLKRGGTFYAATNGDGGIRPFVRELLSRVRPGSNAFAQAWSFSLQNGAEMLGHHFTDIQRLDYEDSLCVTDTQDLTDWILSTISAVSVGEWLASEARALFDALETIRQRDGAIRIPKECGLFVAKKRRDG